MNRTSVSHRVVALVIVAVLGCGWLQATATGQNMAPPKETKERIFKVYRLRYADPTFIAGVIMSLFKDDNSSGVAIDARIGAVLVRGLPEEQEKALEVIKTLDVPADKKPETETQIKIFTLVHADPMSAAQALATLLPKGAHVAVDDRTRSLVASGPREALAIAEAVLTRLDVEANGKRPKTTANYEVRIVLLANDTSGAPPAEDLKDVVGELSRLGVKDPRQFGQMVVQTSSGQSFQLSSLPDFIGGPPLKLTASGRLLEHNEGAVELEISIRAVVTRDAHGEERNLSDLHTRIVVPQKQYVVLATAPVGKITSVFVVQVTGRPSVGRAK
jgi:type II secretory pathway component GspD/PulD (secretin)